MPELLHQNAINPNLTLVVYAPFGADQELSTYPDATSQTLLQHPLMAHLWAIAERGINVVALIDRYMDDTYLVEMPACGPHTLSMTSRWKQDMGSFRTLRGLLLHAHQRFPGARMILSLEGHGAGYWPDVDTTYLPLNNDNTYTQALKWELDEDEKATPKDAITGTGVGLDAVLPTKGGVLPTKGGVLPTKGGVLPTKGGVLPGAPISTYGIGRALQDAMDQGLPRLAIIHFNNCFNFTIELLNTLVGTVDYAVGYPSYNFFTSGEALERALAIQHVMLQSNEALALQLAEANRDVLASRDGHPTVGGMISLSEGTNISQLINDLAEALIQVLPDQVDDVQQAIVAAMQYDTSGDFDLEGRDDDITDVHQLAFALSNSPAFAGTAIPILAGQLHAATSAIKQYGAIAHPWVAPTKLWNYLGDIGLSIFLPDPQRSGILDWRTPYYLDQGPSLLQPNIISFLQRDAPKWVEFLRKYLEAIPPITFKPVRKLIYPTFNLKAQVPPVEVKEGNPPAQSV